jgi:hypothetical protein
LKTFSIAKRFTALQIFEAGFLAACYFAGRVHEQEPRCKRKKRRVKGFGEEGKKKGWGCESETLKR